MVAVYITFSLQPLEFPWSRRRGLLLLACTSVLGIADITDPQPALLMIGSASCLSCSKLQPAEAPAAGLGSAATACLIGALSWR